MPSASSRARSIPAMASLLLGGLLAAGPSAPAPTPLAPPVQAERLGRGVVAVGQPGGRVLVSWRLLVTDAPGATQRNGDGRLRLQTLDDGDGYWRDTGRLVIP